MACNEWNGDPKRAFDCFWRAAPYTEFPVFRVSVVHHLIAGVPARATGAKPKEPQWRAARPAPLTHATTRNLAVWDLLSECFATTLVNRWQLVCRRLGWTRGAQLVSFMCYARTCNYLSALRKPFERGPVLQSWGISSLNLGNNPKI
jgi:hypothetical protein